MRRPLSSREKPIPHKAPRSQFRTIQQQPHCKRPWNPQIQQRPRQRKLSSVSPHPQDPALHPRSRPAAAPPHRKNPVLPLHKRLAWTSAAYPHPSFPATTHRSRPVSKKNASHPHRDPDPQAEPPRPRSPSRLSGPRRHLVAKREVLRAWRSCRIGRGPGLGSGGRS